MCELIARDIKSASCANKSHSPLILCPNATQLFVQISFHRIFILCDCDCYPLQMEMLKDKIDQHQYGFYQLGRSKDGNIHQNILVQGCPCFFLQTSTKPSLFVLSGDNLVQDMTYWGLEGDVQGLTLEINHTHICADFSLNKFSSMKLFMCNCI